VTHPKWITRKRKDLKYEKFVRSKPCCVCGQKSVVHHVWHCRNDSYISIGLCVFHHTYSPVAYHTLEHDEFERVNKICCLDVIINNMLEYILENKFGEHIIFGDMRNKLKKFEVLSGIIWGEKKKKQN